MSSSPSSPEPSAALASAPMAAIVVAAGRGERFGAALPKQALPALGKPLARWAVEALLDHPNIEAVLCVLPNDPIDAALVGKALGQALDHPKSLRPVAGGRRRQDSVLAGLSALPESVEIVAVHDGARPFPPAAGIARALEIIHRGQADGAILAIPVADTIKQVGGERVIEGTVDRSHLWAAQTPQVFRRAILEKALAALGDEPITDEAQAVERAGGRVVCVLGSADNIKVTYPDDLHRVEAIAAFREKSAKAAAEGMASPSPSPEFAAGFGYDVHQLAEGRKLIIGGVHLEHDRGLLGHSDADVLAHAIMDALLGAAGLGDIGKHFPPSENAWKDADSIDLLRRVWAKVAAAGWRLANVDATVVAERPKLGPRFPEMSVRLASALCVEPGRVHLKATTSEKMGFVGRQEGIAAYAMALLWRPAQG